MTSLRKLVCESLPPKEAFRSELKNEDISYQNYAYCEQIWRDHDMKTFRDFLIWYNNRDLVPFLEAIEKQFLFYKLRHIDMFKDGIRAFKDLFRRNATYLKKNANLSRDDIGEFMYSYATKHDILKQPRRSLIGSYYGEKIVLPTPL